MDSLREAADELRNSVNQTHTTPVEPISALWAQRFAVAAGDTEEVYHSRAAALAAGWRSQPLPPLLLTSTRSWLSGPPNDRLADDGTPLDDVGFPKGYGLRALGGGQSLEWSGEPVVEEAMSVDTAVRSVNEKSGRSGDLLVVEIERTFFGLGGQPLLVCHESRLFR